MRRKDQVDAFGAAALVGFSALLGFNQVVVKLVNGGLQPVFNAGLRSVLAAVVVLAWMRWRNVPLRGEPGTLAWGMLSGAVFGAEFLCLFIAIDLTTVARVSVIFYSMPIWLAIMAHLLVSGDRLTARKVLGLALAMAGVAWAILDRDSGQGTLGGDLLALAGALGWAAIALITKVSPFSRLEPEAQLFWQVAVSAPLLLLLAPLFGPLIRDFHPVLALGVAFQVALVAVGFLCWFWLLKVYPASGVASFAFLSPVFGVVFGWLVLGETVGLSLWGALALVAAGLVLINRAPRVAAISAQTGR